MAGRTKAKSFKEQLQTIKSPVDVVLSPAYLLANYGLSMLGFDLLERQMDTSIEQFHSPKARAKILKDNVAGIKTTYLNDPVKKIQQSIKTHLTDTLTRGTTGFETLKQTLEPGLSARDSAAIAKNTLLTRIEADLHPTRALDDELHLFTQRMDTLQELLEGNLIDNPRVIAAYIKAQYTEMLEQLKRKKKADTDLATAKMRELSGQFTPAEITALETALKKDINDAFDKAQAGLDKDFQKGIDPAKPKEGETADKGTPSHFSNLNKATQQAEAELHSFVLFSEKSKSKKVVESNLTMGLGTGQATKGRKYRNITFEEYAADLPARDSSWITANAWFQYGQSLMNQGGTLISPSGLRFDATPDGIKFSFPSHSSFFHHYQDRLMGAEMMVLINKRIQDGKDPSKDTITLTLEDITDPKLRKKMMEEFYYAAHLKGFSDDRIKFNICACPRASHEEEKKPIDNKSASEIMGQLGRAPQRAHAKKAAWDQQQAELDKTSNIELNRDVETLSERIDNIINPNAPAISAVGRYM